MKARPMHRLGCLLYTSVIVVQPGEKVPIDGVIVEGSSTLNTSALTGESVPRDAKCGDEIISGCINMSGVLQITTTQEFGESTVSKILDLVEKSSSVSYTHLDVYKRQRQSRYMLRQMMTMYAWDMHSVR